MPLVGFLIICLSLQCLVTALEQNLLPVGLKSPAIINDFQRSVCHSNCKNNRRIGLCLLTTLTEVGKPLQLLIEK